MVITAIKNGIKRNFTERQWKLLPKDKFGWVQIGQETPTNVPLPLVPSEIIQKKITHEKVVTVTKDVPDELKQVIPKPEKTLKYKKNDKGLAK
jgi:hypothetical protein